MSSEFNYEQTVIKVVTEYWRLLKLFQKVLATKLEPTDTKRYENQIRFIHKSMENSLSEIGLNIVNIEGQLFDPGVAGSPMNLDDFNEGDELYIEQVLEPLIMGVDGIKKYAIFNLSKVR